MESIIKLLKSPNLNVWMRITEESHQKLKELNDEFAFQLEETVNQKLTGEKAQEALQAIQVVLDIRGLDSPEISRVKVSKIFSELAYFKNPEMEFEDLSLKPLVSSSFGKIAIEHIEASFENIETKLCLLRGTQEKTLKVIITDGNESISEGASVDFKDRSVEDNSFIRYYDNDEMFIYVTGLLTFKETTNACYAYSGITNGEAGFEGVSSGGELLSPLTRAVSGLEDLLFIDVSISSLDTTVSDSEYIEAAVEGPEEEDRIIDSSIEDSDETYRDIYMLFEDLRKGSTGVVAGEELTDVQRMIYTKTALHRHFKEMLQKEDPDLVIISGNAGDGKSTLMRKLKEDDLNSVTTGRRKRLISWNFDATHSSSPSQSQKDDLKRYFEPFSDDHVDDKPDKIRIIAMNTGMALSFFEEIKRKNSDTKKGKVQPSFNTLERTVLSMMDLPLEIERPPSAWNILLIDLGRRALFNLNSEYENRNKSETPEKSLAFDLIETFTSLEYWKACTTCRMHDKCFIAANISMLKMDSVKSFLEYLLMRVSYASNRHLTIRDFWEFLSECVGGNSKLHEELRRQFSDEEVKSCVWFMAKLVENQFYGEIMNSLIYNAPFQIRSYFDDDTIVNSLQDTLTEEYPEKHQEINLEDELENEWSRWDLEEDNIPRILKETPKHDPASLSGELFDKYVERIASDLLEGNYNLESNIHHDLLIQEKKILEKYTTYLSSMLQYTIGKNVNVEIGNAPYIIKQLAGLIITFFKRRHLFSLQNLPDLDEFSNFYNTDYITSYVQDIIIPARDYIQSDNRSEKIGRELIDTLLTDLLPKAIMASEGLDIKMDTITEKPRFFISLDPRNNKGELAQYIAATEFTVKRSMSKIHLGSSFEERSGSIKKISSYRLFDPVPMEVYIKLAIEGHNTTVDFKIDALTYDLLSGVVNGKQPSLNEDAMYKNFTVIKNKIRKLALDRSRMLFFDLYGAPCLNITQNDYEEWNIAVQKEGV